MKRKPKPRTKPARGKALLVKGVCVYFTPAVVLAMDRTAERAGLSRSQWLRRLVVRAVGTEAIAQAGMDGRQLELELELERQGGAIASE